MQVGDEVLRADHDRQAVGFDVAREQLDQPVLLFDHPEQRAQRLERALAIGGFAGELVDEERRALHVQRLVRR